MEARPLLLIRRRRPLGEPPDVEGALARGERVVDAPISGTRIAAVLGRLVPSLRADAAAPVTQWLPDLDAGPISLGERAAEHHFAVVALASHLVNVPNDELRRSLLSAAARHAAPGATVLVEHHPVDWTQTAAESWTDRPDGRLGMVDVRASPPFVSAVSVYEVGEEIVRQPFTARVLSDEELATELAHAGLARVRRRSPTWLEAQAPVTVSLNGGGSTR